MATAGMPSVWLGSSSRSAAASTAAGSLTGPSRCTRPGAICRARSTHSSASAPPPATISWASANDAMASTAATGFFSALSAPSSTSVGPVGVEVDAVGRRQGGAGCRPFGRRRRREPHRPAPRWGSRGCGRGRRRTGRRSRRPPPARARRPRRPGARRRRPGPDGPGSIPSTTGRRCCGRRTGPRAGAPGRADAVAIAPNGRVLDPCPTTTPTDRLRRRSARSADGSRRRRPSTSRSSVAGPDPGHSATVSTGQRRAASASPSWVANTSAPRRAVLVTTCRTGDARPPPRRRVRPPARPGRQPRSSSSA